MTRPQADDRPDDRFAVCVFTSASPGLDPSYTTHAAELGGRIAEAGWRLVYGGGQVGLMGVIARAALAAGGCVTGVIPHKLNRREVAFDDIDDLLLVDTLSQRKVLMDDRTDAYVALPGGIGTLDELVEVMTTRQLGYHRKPIYLAAPDDYWAPLQNLLDHMVDRGTLQEDTRQMLTSTHDIDTLISHLTADRGSPTT